MQRIDTATKATDLFGAGKHGFKDGDPLTGIPATQLVAKWFNHVQEELCRVIEGNGVTLDPDAMDQLSKALNAEVVAVRNTGTVSLPNMTATKVPLETVIVDPRGGWDVANRRFRPSRPGYYWVAAYTLGIALNAAAQGHYASISKNGGIVYQGTIARGSSTAVGYIGSIACGPVLMNGTTDYVEMLAYQDSGAAKTLETGQAHLNAFRLMG